MGTMMTSEEVATCFNRQTAYSRSYAPSVVHDSSLRDFAPSTVLFQGQNDAASGTSRSPALYSEPFYSLQTGGGRETLFQTLSHSALGNLRRYGRLFGVYASRGPGTFQWLPLNPKSASIPSEVFRKRLKKSVRFSSTSFLIGCRLQHKPAFYEVIIFKSRAPQAPRAG
jgi:hypothetical protein